MHLRWTKIPMVWKVKRGGIWFVGNGVGKGNEAGGYHSLLEREISTTYFPSIIHWREGLMRFLINLGPQHQQGERWVPVHLPSHAHAAC